MFSLMFRRNRVAAILRVENKVIWLRYARQRAVVADVCDWDKGHPNETKMFHGTNISTALKICQKGFDIRQAEDDGLCGQG